MHPDLTWESFVAGLAGHYAPRSRQSDCVLWRTKPNREMVCREREIRTANYVGLEMHVEHNDQVYLTELHRERVAFSRRVAEI